MTNAYRPKMTNALEEKPEVHRKRVKSHRPKVEEIEENMDGETNLSIRGACR